MKCFHTAGIFIAAFLFICSAKAELFVLEESISPDKSSAFAINYPPAKAHAQGWAQGCFVNPNTRKRLGDYFYLPDISAENNHPGAEPFDSYNRFDFVWSEDCTHIAVIYNHHFYSILFAFFKGSDASFKQLKLPDIRSSLDKRMTGILIQSIRTETEPVFWMPNNRLTVKISRTAQVSKPEETPRVWKNHSIVSTILFEPDGDFTVESEKFSVSEE